MSEELEIAIEALKKIRNMVTTYKWYQDVANDALNEIKREQYLAQVSYNFNIHD